MPAAAVRSPPSARRGGAAGYTQRSMAALYILGTGLLAEEFFSLATTGGHTVEAFVENLDPGRARQTLCGRPILWIDDLPAGAPSVCALSCVK